MLETSTIPRFAWIIVAVPVAILILSFSWLIFTYAYVIKSAKESTVSTPWLTITSKVNTLDASVQDILAQYNQVLAINAQLMTQLNKIKTAWIASLPVNTTEQSYVKPTELPSLMHNLEQQSSVLVEQKQKLQGISTELQSVKQQFQSLVDKK